MLVLATLSYRFIETPFRFKNNKQNSRVILSGAFAISSAIFVMHMIYNAPVYSGKNSSARESFAGIFPPKVCNIFDNYNESLKLDGSCGAVISDGEPTIYLMGDSHANQFTSSLLSYGKRNNVNLVVAVGNSCNFPAIGDSNGLCFKRQSEIEESVISKVKNGDVVIVGNALINRLGASDDLVHEFEDAMKKFSSEVRAKGGTTVLFIDSVQFPGLSIPAALCSTEWFRFKDSMPENCFFSLKKHRSIIGKILPWRQIWSDNPHNIIWDATDYQQSCEGDVCNAGRYLDSNHFSSEYADRHFQKFSEHQLDRIIAD